MKRKEEINIAAKNKYPYIKELPQTSSHKAIFIEGAEWADKTMLDRACSVFSDILIEICPELLGYGAGAEAWENEFRKRLEGGAE